MNELEISSSTLLGQFSFVFKSYKADAHLIANPITQLDTEFFIKVSIDFHYPLIYAFEPSKGLVLLDYKTHTILEEDILGKLISLKTPDDYVKFIKTYGFFYRITNDFLYQSIKVDDMKSLINRLKNLIDLRTNITESNTNYGKAILDIIHLLFEDSYEIDLKYSDAIERYYSSNKEFLDLFNNTARDSEAILNDELSKSTGIQFYDAMIGKPYIQTYPYDFYARVMSDEDDPLEDEDIEDWSSEEEIIEDPINTIMAGDSTAFRTTIFRNTLTNIFRQKDSNYSYSHILKCHFLLILQLYMRCGIDDFSPSKLPTHNFKIDDSFYELVLKTAKQVISDEINQQTVRISPYCDPTSLKPKWQIKDLMSALYFSIFYQDPNLVIYRQCANPNCKQYFMVRTTASNKKYCSVECGNLCRQQRYRDKNKKI